jgi:cytochrome P450
MTDTAATSALASIDLTDNDAFVDRVPYEWFDALRRDDPVHWQPERHGRGFWAVTSHADVVAVSKDWATFSSQTGASALEDLAPDALAARRSMIDADPPLHTELRGLVSAPFAVRPVRDYEEMVRSLSRQVLAAALAQDRFDFVERVAAAVPIKVLCRLLGVPEQDEGLLIDLGDQMIANTDPDLAAVLLDGGDSEQYRLLPFRSPAALQMFAYSRPLCEARQRQPRPDLVTALVHGTIGGHPLPQHEIDAMFLLLVVAGNETTRQAIALGVQALLEHPDQIAVLHSADDRGWRLAVEELLRWTTPLHHFRRTATRDITLGQSKIAAGEKVVVWYTSANRDENVFQDPYRLDLRRSPNPHTTFGRGGPHRCLGEHLARLELRVLLQELLPVLPRLEPDGKPARIRSNFTNGLKHLPVRISHNRPAGSGPACR